MGSNETTQERALQLRAEGCSISAIMRATGLRKSQVKRLIERARKRGDERAVAVLSPDIVTARRERIRALCAAGTPAMDIVRLMDGQLGRARTLEMVHRFRRMGVGAEPVTQRPECPQRPKHERARSLGIEPMVWAGHGRIWRSAQVKDSGPVPVTLPRLRFLENDGGAR